MKLLSTAISFLCIVSSAQAATQRIHFDFKSTWTQNHWSGEWQKNPGEPIVPRVTARVLLPFGEELSQIKFEAGERLSAANYGSPEIAPYPKPLCGDVDVQFETPSPRGNGPYPASTLGKAVTVIKHGYRIVYVPIFPVAYSNNPGQEERIESGDLVVESVKQRSPSLYRGLDSDRDEVRAMIDGPSELSTYPAREKRRGIQYLAIGPAELVNDWNPEGLFGLFREKAQRGITTGVLSTEDIDAKYAGQDLQEKIRNAIKDRYKDGLKYVLLVGNGYDSTPTKILKVRMSEGNIPSDFYYACLDGTFNGTDDDLACEVAVGRAPASNTAQLRTFVAKTLKMQRLSPSDPRVMNALNFGEQLDGSTLGSGMLEQLVNGGKAGKITTVGYPTTTRWKKMYESFSQNFSSNEATSALSSGDYYTVNHMGHAMETYCMRFMSNAIPTLTNTLPFFAITQGCHPGDLKGRNWASDMVVASSGGAGAIVANSNYGFYDGSGSTDGPSNHYHLAFYDAVFADGLRDLGHAHFRAKEKLIPEASQSALMKWVVYETNLLGDPELQLKFPK